MALDYAIEVLARASDTCHGRGLVYCDVSGNVIQTGKQLKLIDMGGGSRRIDDEGQRDLRTPKTPFRHRRRGARTPALPASDIYTSGGRWP